MKAVCTSVLAICLSAVVFSQSAPSQKTVLIRQVHVFDGRQDLGIKDVLVQDGVVRSVSAKASLPPNASVIDGSGKTLLPAFIDAHAHIFDKAQLKQALAFGVATELDMFTDIRFVNQIKKEEAAGEDLDLADIRSAGVLATPPKGHGTEYGFPIPTLTLPGEAQAWVDARLAEGSDYIKIVYDDASSYGTPRRVPTLSKETMTAVVTAAHKRGKLAVVHIGGLQDAEDAINAGADGLAHLFIGPASEPNFGKLAAQHHVFVIPTLSVLHSVCGDANFEVGSDPRIAKALTAKDIKMLETKFPIPPNPQLSCAGAEQSIKQLVAEHVPILAGTDVPNPGTVPGASVHGELQRLVQAGLTPVQALTSATSAPAQAFRLEDRGIIASGKRADLLLVSGDPTRDITATRNIVAVFKQGVETDRQSYLADILKQNQEAANPASAPAPKGSESGLVSDFEDGKPTSTYGSWTESTDSIAGGKSTAKMEVSSPGANSSKGSLHITAEIAPGLPYAWGGAMFMPGEKPMAPANLSAKKVIRFWTRGDGKTYRVMILTASNGPVPLTKIFAATSEWQEIVLPINSFNGIDGHDILGIVFAGGPQPGTCEFFLDDLRVE